MIKCARIFGLLAATLLAPAMPGLAPQAHAQVVDPLKPGLEADAAEDDLLTPGEPDEVIKAAPPPVKRKRRRAVIEEPYAPQGLGLGGLRLYPVLEVDAVTSTDTKAGLRVKPSAQIRSDWSRHAFEAGGEADFTYGVPEEDFTDLTASASSRLRIDIRRGFTGTLESRYRLERIMDSNSELPAAAADARVDRLASASAALEKEFGPLRLRGKAGVAVQLYGDVKLNGGGTEDNADREFAEPDVSARLTYDDGARLKPFGEVAYRPRLHFKASDRNGLDRDSHGLVLSAGLSFDDAPFWTGDIALSYILRDYEDAALDTSEAVGLSGALTWRPTELTEIVFNAATGIEETSSATSGGSPNYTAGAVISQDLREYLTLTGGLNVEFADIGGSGGDWTVTPRLGLIYRITPELAITGGASVEWFDAAGAGGSRTDYTVTTGVEFRR